MLILKNNYNVVSMELSIEYTCPECQSKLAYVSTDLSTTVLDDSELSPNRPIIQNINKYIKDHAEILKKLDMSDDIDDYSHTVTETSLLCPCCQRRVPVACIAMAIDNKNSKTIQFGNEINNQSVWDLLWEQ